ncbi:hypothetical protein [Aureibacter tunicatorum]|uniref:Lipoprotein n=1 Tax=Aureibacter tunicatorum TaxID=866807 RepID=A0AAE3XTZ3_9BACT|nr:hypothetical protein [Aureibacter tunicatorum]MDR6241919.1 hypothetical protein [Aureibacter tunicatorum]BDD07468.1 hypothetical protein AUTU_49510 [Aureibacter tunicatorum]
MKKLLFTLIAIITIMSSCNQNDDIHEISSSNIENNILNENQGSQQPSSRRGTTVTKHYTDNFGAKYTFESFTTTLNGTVFVDVITKRNGNTADRMIFRLHDFESNHVKFDVVSNYIEHGVPEWGHTGASGPTGDTGTSGGGGGSSSNNSSGSQTSSECRILGGEDYCARNKRLWDSFLASHDYFSFVLQQTQNWADCIDINGSGGVSNKISVLKLGRVSGNCGNADSYSCQTHIASEAIKLVALWKLGCAAKYGVPHKG